MQKTLITSVTAFAIILSAGMSMAGPSPDHGQRGHAHDVSTTVSQGRTHTETKSKTHQATKESGVGSGLTSQPAVGQDCQDACTDAYS